MEPLDHSQRYIRQTLFQGLGEDGQQRISQSKVLVCGCGALGSVIANTLARAGVGTLRIVDRDFLELNNLQRQVLYDESDVADHLPKAVAAAKRLQAINSTITIEPVVADVSAHNIGDLLQGIDAIVDGTDNFETRYLLNDAAHANGIPWVYGGCIGSEGQSMTIIPGRTPCFRCLMPETPAPGTTPTCDTAGILAPIVNIVASLQSTEILKLVSGNEDAIQDKLTVIDIWENRIRHLGTSALQSPDCPTCGRGIYDWLNGDRGSHTAVLCGRNAVQLAFPEQTPVDLERLAHKLAAVGTISRNPFLLRAEIGAHVLTVFPDGRAVIAGTDDPSEARSIYARYLGN